MAVWDNIESRGNVEDRRGMVGLAGGVGIVGIALIAGITLLTGGDLGDVLGQLIQLAPQNSQVVNTTEFEGEDDYERFASTVLGSNNDMWVEEFTKLNKTYDPPRLVLFRSATQSACGSATSQVGPHYCPLDQTIYLDETFFDELVNYLDGPNGDVAQAYVISHEVGHHIQNELGLLNSVGSSNEASIQIELQADCFAGLWGNYIKELNVLGPNEIQEAIDAAEAVGDDRIQEKVNGQINPESWTHGSSEQRVGSFNKGYNTGSFTSCQI